ncbi:MAG: DUF4115 domain-containing protein [Nitrospirae bacterium]|nr:DUF4115 domain-containing protein [Nitrospirota bacterium]
MSNMTSISFAEAEVKQENRKENETIGTYLKRVRTTCGHTLEDVAQVTKINIRYLEAIENDEFSKIPGDTFLKGFLRSYSRFLNIDEHEITGRLKEKNKAESNTLKIHTHEEYKKNKGNGIRVTPKNIKIILTSAGGLVVILLLVLFFSSGRETTTIQSSKNIHAPSVSLSDEPVMSGAHTKDDDNSLPFKGRGRVGMGLFSGEAKQRQPVPVSTQPVAMKVYAKELTWMQANIDGNNIQEKLLKPGEEVSWNAQEKIILTVGNAGGIDMEINGKKQEPLGKSGGVLKGVVVTSAGVLR